MADTGKVILGVGIIGGLALLFLSGVGKKEVALNEGYNEVVYSGKRQTAEKAFASIMDYLIIVYYLDEDMNWQLVLADHIMEPGKVYYIKVSQDCVWRF